MNAPKLKLIAADFFERPVTLRLPFRFRQRDAHARPRRLFVRARIKLADGREGEGVSAEMLAPKWFDKSPELTNEQNFEQLRTSLAMAKQPCWLPARTRRSACRQPSIHAAHQAGAAMGLNGLITSFGLALIDRAIIDALARLEGVSVFDLVEEQPPRPRCADRARPRGLRLRQAAREPDARADHPRAPHGRPCRLRSRAPKPSGKRIDDGLPESLEEIVGAYGHRYYKLKVSGRIDADIDRLSRHRQRDRPRRALSGNLDGNEQYHDIGDVTGAVAPHRRGRRSSRG